MSESLAVADAPAPVASICYDADLEWCARLEDPKTGEVLAGAALILTREAAQAWAEDALRRHALRQHQLREKSSALPPGVERRLGEYQRREAKWRKHAAVEALYAACEAVAKARRGEGDIYEAAEMCEAAWRKARGPTVPQAAPALEREDAVPCERDAQQA